MSDIAPLRCSGNLKHDTWRGTYPSSQRNPKERKLELASVCFKLTLRPKANPLWKNSFCTRMYQNEMLDDWILIGGHIHVALSVNAHEDRPRTQREAKTGVFKVKTRHDFKLRLGDVM